MKRLLHYLGFGTKHPRPDSVSLASRCRVLAILLLLLTTLGVGNAWGTEYTYTSFTTSFVKGTTNGTDISDALPSGMSTLASSGASNYASFSGTNCYYKAAGAGIRISKKAGAGNITFTLSNALKDSTIYAIVVYASRVSGNTAAKLDITPTGPAVNGYTTVTNIANGTLHEYNATTYPATTSLNTYKLDTIKVNGKKIQTLDFASAAKGYTMLHAVTIITQTEKAAVAPAYTVTATSSNNDHGTVSVDGTTITATPADCYQVVSGTGGYTLNSGTVSAITHSGTSNTITVTPTSNCSITVNFEKKTVNTYIDGVQDNDEQESCSTTAPTLTDKTAATTGTCAQQHYHFVGWVSEANKANPTAQNIVAGGSTVTVNGTNYYAIWAKGSSGSSATVTFKTNNSDSSTDISSDFSGQVSSSSGMSSYSGSKIYSGSYGLKIGSGSAIGSVTCTLSSSITTKTITVDAKQYGTNSANIVVTVNGGTSFGSALAIPSSGDILTFSLAANADPITVSSVTVSTSAKQGYLKTITVGEAVSYSDYRTECCTELAQIKGSVNVNQVASGANAGKLQVTWDEQNDKTGWADNGLIVKIYKEGTAEAIHTSTAQSKSATSYVSNVIPDYCSTYYAKLTPVKANNTYCEPEEGGTPVDFVKGGQYTYSVTLDGMQLKSGETEEADNCSDFEAIYEVTGTNQLDLTEVSVTNAGEEGTGWEWNSGTGTLFINSEAVTGNVEISITGNAPATPTITLSQTTDLNLGNVNMGGSVSSQTFTVNASNLSNNLSVTLSGEGKDYFSVSPTAINHSEGSVTDAEVTISVTDTDHPDDYIIAVTVDDGDGGATAQTFDVLLSVLQTYTVNFYINDTETPVATQTDVAGIALTVPSDFSAFTDCSDFYFVGWKEGSAIDGGSTTSAPTLVANVGTTIPAANKNYYAVFAEGTPGATTWDATALGSLEAGDVFVIVGDNGNTYALPNDGGASKPAATAIEVSNEQLSNAPAANLQWNLSGNSTDGYTFYPNGSTTTWLYLLADANDGVRIGNTESNNVFTIDEGYLYCSTTTYGRYVGIYNSQDWRCYKLGNNNAFPSNIENQTFTYYKKTTSAPNFTKWYTTCPHFYSVNLTNSGVVTGKGSFEADPTSAEAGTSVTLTATGTENAGRFNSWSVTGLTLEEGDELQNPLTITMPANDITVSATFDAVYAITKELDHGTFDLDKNYAIAGETVTISNVAADAQYENPQLEVYYVENEVKTTVSLTNNTFSMPAHDVKVKVSCTPTLIALAAPTLTATPTYQGVSFSWTGITDNEGYVLTIEGFDPIEIAKNATSYEKATGLAANTTYNYSIYTKGNGTTTLAVNTAANSSFSTEDYPAATLYYSENGVLSAGVSQKILTDFELDEPTSDPCEKKFVGWSTVTVAETNTAPSMMQPGATYQIPTNANCTIYAVYANGGSDELTITPSAVTGSEDPYTYTIDQAGYSLTANKTSSGSTAPAYNGTASDVRVYANGTVTLTAPKNMTKIVFNISTQGKKRLAPITASVGTIATQASEDETVTWTGKASSVSFTVGATADYGSDGSSKAGQLCFGTIDVEVEGTYSNYSTECAASPEATAVPTSLSVSADATSGTITMTYENVKTSGVTVALYNNATCTEAFDGEWLTASLDNGNIAYTIAANNSYTDARTAYIKLTAPQKDEATDPAVVIIPVEQAKKATVFANLADLVAASLATGTEVTVTYDELITGIYANTQGKKKGLYLTTLAANDKAIELYYNQNNQLLPDAWVIGGKASATAKVYTWTYYSDGDQWELVPTGDDRTWTDNDFVTYTAPVVSSIAISGTATKTNYSAEDNQFSFTGLTATATYNTGYVKDVTSEVTWKAAGVTSYTVAASGDVNVTATLDEVTSDPVVVAVTYTSKTIASISLEYSSTYTFKGFALPKPRVTASYVEDIPNEDITTLLTDDNYDTENVYVANTPDTYTITVSYAEKTATYDVEVRAIYNTKETAHSVADAITIINAVAPTGTTADSENMYVRGVVSTAGTPVASGNNAGKLTYYINDSETTDGQLQVYQGLYFASANFTSDNNLAAGDEVIVEGHMLNYNSNTPELKASPLVYLLKKALPTISVSDVAELEVGQADLDVAESITKQGNGAVTLVSGDNEKLTIDGTVLHAVAAGDVEVTVNLAATNNDGSVNYKANSTTFNVTVVAAKTRYAVTFDADGGTGTDPVIANQLEGATVNLPANPYSKANSAFAGWVVNDGAITITDGHFTMPAAAVTIKATWNTVATCAISFQVSGSEVATADAPQTAEFSLAGVSHPTIEGFTWIGWSETEYSDEVTTLPTTISSYTPEVGESTKTLYGIYSQVVGGTSNLHYVLDYADENLGTNTSWGSSYGSAYNYTAADGGAWVIKAYKNSGMQINTGKDASIKIPNCSADIISISITCGAAKAVGLSASDYSGSGTITYIAEGTDATSQTLDLSGKSVKGGYIVPKSGSTAITHIDVEYSGNVTYYTSSPITRYNVTYAKGDATGVTGLCEAQRHAAGTITLCDAPTCSDKNFAKWSDGSSLYSAGASYTLSADVTFTATWTPKPKYTVTYTANGGVGTAPDVEEYMEGETVEVKENEYFEKPGFDYDGWLIVYNDGVSDQEITPENGEFEMVAFNVTIKAKWAEESKQKWALVTEASQLEVNAKYVIAAAGYDYAMAAQKSNNRDATAIVKRNEGAQMKGTSSMQVITLEGSTGAWAFNTGAGYLYAASSSGNQLKTQTTNDVNGQWAITFENGVTSVVASGSSNRNVMQFNNGSTLFACYATASQSAVALYKEIPMTVINTGGMDQDDVPDGGDMTINEDQTWTVTSDKEVGDLYMKDGAIIANSDGSSSAKVEANDLYFKAKAGKSNQVYDASKLAVNGDLYYDFQLCNGSLDADYWYSIAVPFDVNLSDGVMLADGTPMVFGTDFDLFVFNTQKRASTGTTGWQRASGKMEAGKAYLIGFNPGMPNTVRLKAAEGWKEHLFSDSSIGLESTTDGTPGDNDNWNGIANPRMRYSSISEDVSIQVFNNNTHLFDSYTNSTTFVVGTAFFVQRAENLTITNTDHEAYRAPKRESDNKYIYTVRIAKAENEYYDNQLIVRASEDATNEYEQGRDMLTMNGTTSKTAAMLWTENYGGKRLAIEEAPLVSDQASYTLGIYAPNAGTYTISVPSVHDNASLYLTKDGAIIWDLTMGEYTAEFAKGNNAGYGIRIVKAPKVATDIENVFENASGAQKVVIDEHVFILRGEKMYDATGRLVK